MPIVNWLYEEFKNDRYDSTYDAITAISRWCTCNDVYIYDYILNDAANLMKANFVTIDDDGNKFYGSIILDTDENNMVYISKVEEVIV